MSDLQLLYERVISVCSLLLINETLKGTKYLEKEKKKRIQEIKPIKINKVKKKTKIKLVKYYILV